MIFLVMGGVLVIGCLDFVDEFYSDVCKYMVIKILLILCEFSGYVFGYIIWVCVRF